MLLVWCHLLTGYEPELVHDNLHKVVPRPPLPVVQVHGERVSSKGHEFEPLSVCTLYTCGLIAGQSWVRESVRYITHDSCAISVVPPFNKHHLNRKSYYNFAFIITQHYLCFFILICRNIEHCWKLIIIEWNNISFCLQIHYKEVLKI